MRSNSENAVTLFNSGFNCSQSVLSTFCEKYGMRNDQALKMSCGLGGGVRSGELCGAVSGAVLVIGLKYGNDNTNNSNTKSMCYSKTVEFIESFKEMNHSIVCRDLLGSDISTKDGYIQAQEQNLFKTTCIQMITDAVNLLERLGY